MQSLCDAATGAPLYTLREAAGLLGFHPFSVYRLVCLGKIGHRRLGPKTLLFSREDLVNYRERSREKPRKGRPMTRVAPRASSALSAVVEVQLEGGRQVARRAPWRQFRWEHIPLIRARLGSRYGGRLKGLRISVRAGEGDEWKVLYRAP